ncbi:hypothetical protein Btru_024137 [Bulinus truncatus]|nr:hypothetical protein Btru_024137 [Bulinus truncatus]
MWWHKTPCHSFTDCHSWHLLLVSAFQEKETAVAAIWDVVVITTADAAQEEAFNFKSIRRKLEMSYQ